MEEVLQATVLAVVLIKATVAVITLRVRTILQEEGLQEVRHQVGVYAATVLIGLLVVVLPVIQVMATRNQVAVVAMVHGKNLLEQVAVVAVLDLMVRQTDRVHLVQTEQTTETGTTKV
tara:strand:+ start:120 stop:473 length:354 start_codon:yes stop_codon:yes gene_type:complete